MVLDFGEEGAPRPPSIFPHSEETDTGQGRERIGQATVLMSLDGSGDTDNLVDALALLPDDGGSIFIKEGIYEQVDQITITKSNVTIQGVGFGTILKLKDTGDGTTDRVLLASSKTNIVIKSIQIDINGSGQTGLNPVKGGIFLFNCKNCIIQEVLVDDGLDDAGITLFSSASTTGENIITNCIIKNGTFNTGIQSTETGAIITDNQIENVGDAGIHFNFAGKIQITGNIIQECGGVGIFLHSGGVECIVANNNCNNNDSSGISSRVDRVILEGNICNDNGGTGIILSAAADRNIVTSNIALGNTTAQFTDNGTNTVSANNIIT